MPGQLKAATARADITPPVGIAHMNWGAQTHERAEGVDLPLWCTALALSDGETDALVVETDLLQLPSEPVDVIRQSVSDLTGVPVSHVRISFSHTHSGPTLGPTWVEAGTEMVPEYVDGLAGKIAGAAWEAHRELQPVRFACGTGESYINVSRRQRLPDGRLVVGYHPKGAVDREVRVVRFDDLDGNPVATVVNYACHPTIMAHLNRLITPDYPGVVRRAVERTLGGTCLFLQGATGDLGPVEGYTGDPVVYHRLGMLLGLEASKVALGLETRPVERRFSHVEESGAPLAIYEEVGTDEPDMRLRVGCRSARLPVGESDDPEKLEAEAKRLSEVLARTRKAGSDAKVREAGMKAKRARAQAGRALRITGRSHLEVEVQAICVGDLALISVPAEPFSWIGVEVKKRSPFAHTLFSGYSNGAWSYIPTAEAFAEGGYEVGMSLFSPQAAETLADEAVALLEEIASDP